MFLSLLDIDNLVLDDTRGGIHIDGAPDFLSEERLAERGLIRDLSFIGIRLRRTDDEERLLLVKLQILNRHTAAHRHSLAVARLDDVGVANLVLELLNLALEKCLLILRVIVLRVLGEITESNGGL